MYSKTHSGSPIRSDSIPPGHHSYNKNTLDLAEQTRIGKFWKVESSWQTAWRPPGLRNTWCWVPWVPFLLRISQTGHCRNCQPGQPTTDRESSKKSLFSLAKGRDQGGLTTEYLSANTCTIPIKHQQKNHLTVL